MLSQSKLFPVLFTILDKFSFPLATSHSHTPPVHVPTPQPILKDFLPILVTLDGIVTFANLLPANALLPIVVRFLLNSISTN